MRLALANGTILELVCMDALCAGSLTVRSVPPTPPSARHAIQPFLSGYSITPAPRALTRIVWHAPQTSTIVLDVVIPTDHSLMAPAHSARVLILCACSVGATPIIARSATGTMGHEWEPVYAAMTPTAPYAVPIRVYAPIVELSTDLMAQASAHPALV